MASLQKTATRDLSTAIAGKIWEAIKDADERKELEKSKASEEVKQAAVKLKKEDPNSIPVKDKDLSETVVKIFGPLEGKLLQTEGKVDKLSAKITTVAGGVADTQKLLINQNQLLEDKFDVILKIIGTKSAIDKQKEAESDFEALEKELEKGLDLSGTFAFEKANMGSFGILGKLLSGILGHRYTYKLLGQIIRKKIPKNIRSRARLLRKTLAPATRFANKLTRPGQFTRNFIKSALKPITSKIGGLAGRAFLKSLLWTSGRHPLQRKGLRVLATALLGDRYPKWMAQRIIDFSEKQSGQMALKLGQRASSKWTQKMGLEAIQRTIAGETSDRAIAGVTVKALNEQMSEGIFSRAMKSSRVQAALLEKLGAEGFEKMTVKFGKGTLKGGLPIAGSIYGAAEALFRLSPLFGGSDWKGAALSLGSGLPIAGWGFTAIDILRDIDVDAYTNHIEGKYPPSEEDIANFFADALGISPGQYETGNLSIKSPIGVGGSTIDSICEILGVTKSFGDAVGFGAEVKGLIGEAGLGSYPVGKQGYKFDLSRGIGGGSIESSANKELELRKKEKYKKDDDDNNKPIIDDDRSSGEKIGDMVGATIDEVDKFVDPVRKITGGKRDDGQFTIFGINIRNPLNTKPNDKGGGGIGGDNNVQATTPIMGGDGATIEFWGQQGRDLSGEPGVDFSYKDYKSNYNLFPGYVLETGLLYGARYGNVVVVRSVDPSNGLEFDSLYSHFPDGGMAVKPGQVVSAGEYLGKVGFVSVDTPGVPQMQPNNAGNMSGWHTSVDFFEPGSSARYRNLSAIQSLVTGADGQSPVGLLEKLKPPSTSNDQSSLNNIEANSKLSSTMTGMVEKGSSERLMTKRKSLNRNPIVIVNNQIIRSNTTSISMGGKTEENNFFEAYNLARHTV